MILYDYIFYKGYQLALSSRNYRDTPIIIGIAFVVGGLILNLQTLNIILEAYGFVDWHFKKEYRYIFSGVLMILLYLYYSVNNRDKRIFDKYEQRERNIGIALHPLLVILIYMIISFGLLILAALYRNKDWIFVSI